MVFADSIAICSKDREQVEESPVMCRYGPKRKGVDESRSKTKYALVNQSQTVGRMKLQGVQVLELD